MHDSSHPLETRVFDISRIRHELTTVPKLVTKGRVLEAVGPRILARVSGVAVGDTVAVTVRAQRGRAAGSISGELQLSGNHSDGELMARVVGFTQHSAILSPFGPTVGIFPGAEVRSAGSSPRITLNQNLLGSVVNSLGQLIESAPLEVAKFRPALGSIGAGNYLLDSEPPPPLTRQPISKPFTTGIRAIDGFVTLGCGQRICVLAEPGVGKSTLMGMIASNSSADVNVIGLIGERGREVAEFIHDTLRPEARARTVVVVSTSDEPAICRVTAASTATRIAEYFREQGLEVLLQIDSLTRLFRAYREVGLAAGELPVRRGYPPSVFAELPRLIERAGTSAAGSITALYTVLLSSDLDEDPMVDEVKGLTDGHLVLRKELAERGHYPAIDVLSSLSRLAGRVQNAEAHESARLLRRLLSRLQSDRELMLLGGTPDAELKQAMELEPLINRFLQQRHVKDSSLSLAQTEVQLREIVQALHTPSSSTNQINN